MSASAAHSKRDDPTARRESQGALAVLIAASLLVVLLPDQEGFGKFHHGYLSSHGAALAKNWSTANRGMMFERTTCEQAGGPEVYSPYNRFPPTAFVVIKAAMLLGADDPVHEVIAARKATKLFFAAAMLCAFLSLRRLDVRPLAALSATLIAFSSYYLAFYDDMIFNDMASLFGVMLVFHGIVTHERVPSPRQLYAKALIAVGFGWQPLALLAVWSIVGIVRHVRRRLPLRALARHTELRVGLVALCVALCLVAWNLTNERITTGLAWQDLPTVDSIIRRTGQDEEANRRYADLLAWDNFAVQQLHRMGRMSVPYTGLLSRQAKPPDGDHPVLPALGFAALLAAGAWAFRGNRRPIGLLFLGGLLWALGMKHFVAYHDFQSPYYIGLPLALWLAVAQSLHRRSAAAAGVAAAAALFVLAHGLASQLKLAELGDDRGLGQDFRSIRAELPPGAKVHVDGDSERLGGAHHGLDFYLAGHCFAPPELADFVVTGAADRRATSRTPDNTRAFLVPASARPTSADSW